MRHLIKRLFPHIDHPSEIDQQAYSFDTELMASLQAIAESEQRPVEEVAESLLSQALHERQMAESRLMPWRKLSPRLKQVTALVCLGYTNGEIAQRLKISPETVKTHLRITLKRFDVRSKVELRELLQDWDFSAWE